MKKNYFGVIVAFALIVGICQAIITPQISSAGSLSFGLNGSGTPAGGTVSINYNDKLEIGTGAFNLEMWVKETSRVAPGQQYTASFWSSSIQYFYQDRSTLTSSFMWGLSFDGPNLFAAWRANQNYFYAAGSNTGLTDLATSNTKTSTEVYNVFTDTAWHHIALSKTAVNGALNMYLDGTRVLYVPNDNHTYSLLGGNLLIGGLKFVGQIGDVRLVKGQALYTGPSLTVPTSEITTTSQGAIASNVSLLLKASSGACSISDFSENHFPVVIDGVTCVGNSSRAVTSYNVQFDKQGHGTTPAEISNVNSIAVSSLPTISNDGIYKFQGWSISSAGTLISGTYTATTDSTLYAIWAYAPDAPTIGAVTRVSATSISVPYTSGAINGSAIASYTTTSSPTIADLTLTSTATANPLTYSGTFVQGQAYTFSMTATNGAGTSSSSGSSTPITPYSASVPATGIIGSVTRSGDTSVSIPFTAPSANGSAITAYTITSQPTLVLTYSGTSSPMAVSGAFVQGQSYTFTIAATNGAGTGAASSSSNAITPFAAARPDAPTIGVATLVDSQTVTVSFTAPLNNRGSAITNYKATSSPGSITATSTGSPITVTGLTINTAYTFTVTATNLIGESDSSTATTSVTPLMSYSVTFNSQGGTSLSDGTFVSGSTVAAPSSTPTRSGYTFNGWFSASTGGSALVFPYAPGVTNAITLYAQWTLIPVVVPPVVVPPVVQYGPPPSILKSLTTPKVARDISGFNCEIGTYVFVREGRTEELPKLTSKIFSLQLNGKTIESIKTMLNKVAFTKNDFGSNSILTCQVEAGQENLVTTSNSLNSALMSKFSMERKSAIEAAYVKYYKDRTDAYAKKSQVFARILLEKVAAMNVAKSSKARISASIAYQKAFSLASNTWKKELAEATKNRDLSKALAQKLYLESLEAAGISIYQS